MIIILTWSNRYPKDPLERGIHMKWMKNLKSNWKNCKIFLKWKETFFQKFFEEKKKIYIENWNIDLFKGTLGKWRSKFRPQRMNSSLYPENKSRFATLLWKIWNSLEKLFQINTKKLWDFFRKQLWKSFLKIF